MKRKDYFHLSMIIFGLAGALHLIRFFKSWDLVIGTFSVPLWVSLVVGIVTAVMVFNGWQMSRKK